MQSRRSTTELQPRIVLPCRKSQIIFMFFFLLHCAHAGNVDNDNIEPTGIALDPSGHVYSTPTKGGRYSGKGRYISGRRSGYEMTLSSEGLRLGCVALSWASNTLVSAQLICELRAVLRGGFAVGLPPWLVVLLTWTCQSPNRIWLVNSYSRCNLTTRFALLSPDECCPDRDSMLKLAERDRRNET